MKITVWGVAVCSTLWLMACGNQHSHGHHHESHEEHTHEAEHRHNHHTAGDIHAGHTHDHEEVEAHGHSAHSGEIRIDPELARGAGIMSEEIVVKPFWQVIAVSGEIISAQGEVQTVVANVPGIVSFRRPLLDGVQVDKGVTLMTISSRNMADGSPVERARIAYEAARKEFERATPLMECRVVSEKEYVRINEAYENARLTYEALKADSQDEGGVRVEAPKGGYIENCRVKEGDYVNVGQPLFTIVRDNRLYLRADVPERHYAAIRRVRSANFRTSYADKIYTLDELDGRLVSYGRSADEQSFYLPVIFEMDNPGGLVPGSFAEIWLLADEMPDVLSVPHTALTEEQGTYSAYVQLDEGCYERREVKLGADNGREVQILSGIHAGERVVMQGAYHVRLASVSKSIPGHSHEH